MTVQENVRQAQEYRAVGLLSKAGVGFTYAIRQVTAEELEDARLLTGADSDALALVLAALQFAFAHSSMLVAFIQTELVKPPAKRFFQGRG